MTSADVRLRFCGKNKLAFAIGHAHWNVGNFKTSIERTIYSERSRYRGRYLSSFSAFPTAAMWTGFVHVLYP